MTHERPLFYSFRRCPYAMRARLALQASGIKVRLREVVLRDKPAEMIEVSPKATVPVIVLSENQVIEESLEIMHWALAQNDPEHWLAEAAESAELIATNDGPFKHHLDRYKYANRYDGVVAEEQRSAASVYLHALDERLAKTGWLIADEPRLADYAILPFVRQFASVDRSWFDAQDWPRLQSWLNRFLASNRFGAVMAKHKQWQTGDPEVEFPSSNLRQA